jgi:hypothetical protein
MSAGAAPRNPFHELYDLAISIDKDEGERALKRPLPPGCTPEGRATVEYQLGGLVAECCLAGKLLGREAQAEAAARQLKDACTWLMIWDTTSPPRRT